VIERQLLQLLCYECSLNKNLQAKRQAHVDNRIFNGCDAEFILVEDLPKSSLSLPVSGKCTILGKETKCDLGLAFSGTRCCDFE